jgi:hypothetical protein
MEISPGTLPDEFPIVGSVKLNIARSRVKNGIDR